jgi:serine/threonine-protein kinase
MAPEQARGRWEVVDEQSDLWSLGATMFALVCGRTVHEAETNNELLLASMTQPAPPVRTFAPDVPEMAAGIIERALAFEKTDRYASAEEMLTELRYAIQVLEEGRRERGFSSLPPIAGTPFEALRSSMPPPPSTFRPVARSERPELTQEDARPQGSKSRRVLLAAAALGMSALVGYFAVSSFTADETAPVAAQQESGEVALPIVEPERDVAVPTAPTQSKDKSKAPSGEPPPDSPDPTATVSATDDISTDADGEGAKPPPAAPAANQAEGPAKVQKAPSPAKTEAERGSEPDTSSDESEAHNFDPLRMRR